MTDLDYEDTTVPIKYSLIVSISDGKFTVAVPVDVIVDPVNDAPPVFNDATITWPEDQQVGSTYMFTATDVDRSPHGISTYAIVCKLYPSATYEVLW